MNSDQIQGIGRQFGGKLKKCWGALWGDPASVAAGRRDCLAGRIQEQRGISKQAADRQIEDFRSRNRKWLDMSKR